jgi:uncharacterized membrane protein
MPEISVASRIVLWLKFGVSTVETILGLTLAVLGAVGADIQGGLKRLALHELREDPTDLIANQVLGSVH